MKVPLLDLKAQFVSIEAEVRAQLDEVLASQHFILGPKVEELEARLAAYCGVAHAVGVSSGTDAILLSLMALGIGPGDEVITTPYTFFATVGGIARLGARPVFVDIDAETFNLRADQLAAAVTDRTRAIVPVHLFGRCADLDAILKVARPRGIPVIEDAAQALGSELGGRRAGSLGNAGCFSFFPSKNLGAFGDGGLVTTQDDALARKLRLMRAHGSQPKYFHAVVGGNFRLDGLQAAVLLAKLPHLDDWTRRREANAHRYHQAFAAAGLAAPRGPVHLPPLASPGDRMVWNQFVVRVPRRDALLEHLKQRGIQTEIYYPQPMHLQTCFAELGHRAGAFPTAEACARDSLALPVYPELAPDAIAYVVETMAGFLSQ
jgi:dTDP-4-amino-4,6-dideoxygalactose transaminase